MTALFAIVTFFFIFVLVYVAVSAMLGIAGWWMTRRAVAGNGAENGARIERRLDRAKDRAFIISIVLTFFIITPFVVIYLFVKH